MRHQKKIEISVNESLCKGTDGCGLCMHVCPKNVYDRADLNERGLRPPVPERIGDCTACFLCMMYCPDFAIVVDVHP